MAEGTSTRIGGLVTQFLKRFTREKQEAMGVFRLETLEGSIEAVAFPQTFNQYAVHLRDEAPVLVCAEVKVKEDVRRLVVNEVYPLDEAHKYFAQKISLHIPAAQASEDNLRKIRQIVRAHPGDIPLGVCLLQPGGEKIFIQAEHTFKVSARGPLIHDLEHVLGEGSVYVEVNPSPCLRPREPKRWERRGGE